MSLDKIGSVHLIVASVCAMTLLCSSSANAGTDTRSVSLQISKPVSRTSAPGAPTSSTPVASSAAQNTPSAAAQATLYDKSTDRLGGKVYSTGVSDVIATILNPRSLQPPTSASVGVSNSIYLGGRRGGVFSEIYLMYPRPERLIGQFNQFGTTVNLGKLPAGEIIFGLKTFDHYTLVAGGSGNNPDKLVHAVARTYASGRIQLWFEDAPGPRGWGRSDRNFTDVVVELTGGVSDSGAVADLLKTIKEQQGPTRQAAINTLKQLNPLAAADAGF